MALWNMSTSSFMCSVLEIYILPAWWLHCLTHVIPLYTYLASLYDDGESANSSPSKDGPEAEAGPILWRGRGRMYVCIISERARSSGRCRDCPHWLRSPSSGAAMQCQRTLTAATSPFSHSPVLSLELLPPAGRLSLFSTSSSCSGTTPSPMGGGVDRKCQFYCSAKIIKKLLGSLTAWQKLSLNVWQLVLQQQLCVHALFHLPLGVYLFFPDSTASTVFTSLRLMIKLLLKTVYTSSSSRGPLSVDTCARREGEEGGGSLLSRRAGWVYFWGVSFRGDRAVTWSGS